MKQYYTLLKFNRDVNFWDAEFGDYDHHNVIDEMEDMRDNDIDKEEYQIIKTGDDQASINEYIAIINQFINGKTY